MAERPFNQQPNRTNNDLNTSGIQFFNSDSRFKSTLQLGFWNKSLLTFRIYKELPENQQTETQKYDYDNGVHSAVPVNKVVLLEAAIPRIIAAYENGNSASVYVDTNGNNLTGFGTMNLNGKQIYYLAIHKALNNDRIPEFSAYFEFSKNYRIEDYDPTTGNHVTSNLEESDFNLFTKTLSENIKQATRAIVHSIKSANKGIEYKIDAIARATGADFKKTSGLFRPSTPSQEIEPITKTESNSITDLNSEDIPF